MIDFRRMGLDLAALGLFAVVVFVGSSLASYAVADPPGDVVFPPSDHIANLCGPVGARVAHEALSAVGFGAYYLLFTLVMLDLRLFARSGSTDPVCRSVGWGLTLAAVCAGFSLVAPALGQTPVAGSGGRFGAAIGTMLHQRFALPGGLIIVTAALVAGAVLSGDVLILHAIGRAVLWPIRLAWRILRFVVWLALIPFAPVRRLLRRRASSKDEPLADDEFEAASRERRIRKQRSTEDDEPSVLKLVIQPEENRDDEDEEEPALPLLRIAGDVEEEDDSDAPQVMPFRPIKVNPPVVAVPRPHAVASSRSTEVADPHELPDLDLLDDAEEFPYELLARKAQVAAETLERTFHEFGLNVTVSEVDTGPVVTQFELNLEKGLRVSKVSALADDLAIALRVPAVRVVSPIPGKNTVGVEVPNEKQVMVRLRELIESSPADSEKHRIPLFLGKDVAGRPLVVDLTKMPHLLIAGRTGTGKSVCLNTLIMSMLMTRSPEDVRMLMIDPKMVELSPYKRIPHLMHPVITDMRKAEAVLGWAVDKMEERYDLLARCGVRHLDSYNKLSRTERLDRMGLSELDEEAKSLPERMPYIIIIADEMADMMMTSGKDVEGHIIRLAQKSRAVGIHLVLATQKPTVDVITGLIKSNLPARISFQVSSKTDSRVVLDENGAERLLGNGDMLYLAPGTSNLIRAQGTYTSGDEVDGVIEFFSDCEPQYSDELARLNTSAAKGGGPGDNRDRDDLYDQAVEVVVREGRGSTSLLQRALGIGYGRAARLIDYMAEDGVVGDFNGSQAREVLYTAEQWASAKAGHSSVGAAC
ncbi:MAG: DNA translocase FtsK [Planctomycetaceae bacterium]